MSARVLVIGLDAAEATLIERWASEGVLPAFAALNEEASIYKLDNCLNTFPAAIWPEINTGRSVSKVGQFYYPLQIHSGEGRARRVLPEEVDAEKYYWARASRAGLRVATFDMPQTVLVDDFNGLQMVEWGIHDGNFDLATRPPELLDEIRAQHGMNPVTGCDTHDCRTENYDELHQRLVNRVAQKTEILLDRIAREDWDLFNAAYCEPHCVGHQFWHFQDPNHPRYDPTAPAHLKDAVKNVYKKIDEGIAKLVTASGPNTTVLVVCSHGMKMNTGGPQLLPEFLARLGMSSAPDSALARALRRAREQVRFLPRNWKGWLYKLANSSPVRSVQTRVAADLHPLEYPHTRAAAFHNNRCGGIRLNLKGREPHGCIAPGNEEKYLIEELRTELLALKRPKDGEPIISRVRTTDEIFGPDRHPDLPDIVVQFRYDIGLVEECTSKRVGHIKVPRFSTSNPRSGDHSDESRLWMKGPGLPASRMPDANTLDITPTILSLLDLPLPAHLDGKALALGNHGSQPHQCLGDHGPAGGLQASADHAGA